VGSNASDAAPRARPRIGVTTYLEVARWGVWDRAAALVPQVYLDGVTRAGGVPLLLPPMATEPTVLDMLDGLVLIGGADVDPDRYGEPRHATAKTRPDRDAHELTLLAAAMERDVPVLGLCRGAQVVNVALGGSLVQHLPETLGHDGHQRGPGVFGSTLVRVEPGTRLADILGPEVKVPCYHHQGLARIADGLRPAATASDGITEAVESTGSWWLLGVQWHPEEDPDDLRLFQAHVDAARARRSGDTARRSTA
jgi:putative glutamine amidotransferase